LFADAVFVLFKADNQYLSKDNHLFTAMPIDYIILFSIPIVFTPLSQDVNLRIKSAKNSSQGKWGLMIGGFFYLSITLAAAYVGIYMGRHGIDLNDPEQAIPIFFRDTFPVLGFAAIIATLSAIVSSLDSYTLNSITSISNDIIRPLTRRKDNPPRNIRIASIITYLLAMAIALFFNKVLALSMTSLLIYISVLLPIAFANRLNLKGKQSFIMAILEIVFIVMVEVIGVPISPKAVIYPVFGCIVVLIIKILNLLCHER
jgi:Sodium:solute symporter family.